MSSGGASFGQALFVNRLVFSIVYGAKKMLLKESMVERESNILFKVLNDGNFPNFSFLSFTTDLRG